MSHFSRFLFNKDGIINAHIYASELWECDTYQVRLILYLKTLNALGVCKSLSRFRLCRLHFGSIKRASRFELRGFSVSIALSGGSVKLSFLSPSPRRLPYIRLIHGKLAKVPSGWTLSRNISTSPTLSISGTI
jgi:hypothetical protein